MNTDIACLRFLNVPSVQWLVGSSVTLADLRPVITFLIFAFDLIDVGWKCGAKESRPE